MTDITGTELPELVDDEESFAALVDREMSGVIDRAVDNLGHVIVAQGSAAGVTPDDLNPMLNDWRARVAISLLPFIAGQARSTALSQLSSLAAGLGVTLPVFDEDVIARMIVQGAANRLSGIGDFLWGNARNALVEGMERGESIGDLSRRVRDSLSVSQRRAETISRTEVIGASNKSSIEVIRATGLVSNKKWIATFDDRVRMSHLEAHDQTVSISDMFSVGDDSLDHPGDPNGAPEEVINCRCAMGYDVTGDETSPSAIAASAKYSTQGMVALIPRDEDIARLAVDGGEIGEDIHLTIAFLGDESEWTADNKASLFSLFDKEDYTRLDAVTGFAFGAAHWNPDSDDPVWVLNVGGEQLEKMHKTIWETLTTNEDDNQLPIPEQHKPWSAHITLMYSDKTDVVNDIESRLGEVVFDRIRVTLGDGLVDIPLRDTIGEDDTVLEADMPWFVEEGHDCPDERPWAVVKESDGEVEGCHETREDAESQMRALLESEAEEREDSDPDDGVEEMAANTKSFQDEDEDGDNGDGECPPGQHRMPDGECMPDEDMVEFEGVAVVEGVWTGDGRQFAKGSLDWPDLSAVVATLQWQKETSHGGFSDVTVSVGRLTSLERSGDRVLVEGFIDAGSDDGREVVRRLEIGTSGGVSIVADDPDQSEIELVWDDDVDDDDADVVMSMPKVIFHSGRIRALTLVDTAAFVEASIRLKDKSADQPSDDVMVASHQFGRVDMTRKYGDVTRSITASSQQLSSFDIINELEPLIAASHTITIPDLPIAEWFNEPTQLPEFGAITVTDEGQLFGLLAPKNIAHRGYADKRITVPTKTVDYSRWMNRVTIVADGSRIATGPITMDCGHAPMAGGSGESAKHYDNTCSVVATARVGENKHGIWIAGAVLPGVKPEQITRMLACQLSGDWRPHKEKPGFRELVAALFVPVPGFPVAASPRIKMDHGALAASAVPMAWQSSPDDTIVPELTTTAVQQPVAAEPSRIAAHINQPNVNVVAGIPSWDDIQKRRQLRANADDLAATLGIEV